MQTVRRVPFYWKAFSLGSLLTTNYPDQEIRSSDNGGVTDQLFLSIWLDRSGRANRRRQFEKLLRLFPFSQRKQPQSTVSVLAVSSDEPPLLEKPMNGPIDIDEVIEMLADYQGGDLAYSLESWWDLWVFTNGDWSMAPTRVLLSCFELDFDNGTGVANQEQEDLRIDFGVDTHYLPDAEIIGSGKLIESNVKSLLRFVHEADTELKVGKRQLQTESGENFAARLELALREVSQVQ